MALLTVTRPSSAGTTTNPQAASAGGDTFPNDGFTFLRIKNGGASPITVTVNSVTQCSQGFTHNLTATVAAGAEELIGTFLPSRFNDTNGQVSVSYSAVASVTVEPISPR